VGISYRELRTQNSVTGLLQVKVNKSRSHIATDGQSISKSWCRVPSGAHDQIFITLLTVTVLFLWGALSDEKTGLSFVYSAGPRQRSLSRVQVPWDSLPYLLSQICDFHFVAPYDSHSHGGGIRTRLHTGHWLTKVKVTLRLEVYLQSVCLGIKPLETHDQNCFSPTERLRY
jgi:hypothetical protein